MRSCCLSFLFASALLAFGGSLSAQTIDSIKGPTPEPLEPIEGIVEGPLPLGAVVLDLPFDYDWWYGCSPTAAGLLFGWWEEHGYPDVFPDNHRDWVLGRPCPSFNPQHFVDAHGVVATWEHHQAGQEQGRYYGSYAGHSPTCLADFMLTIDGGTYESKMAWGFENFAAWDDPETPECESYAFDTQTLWVYQGWTYENYCAEIDAGRPVHLGMSHYSGAGHSVLGLGYNNTGGQKKIYLYTTWHSGLVEWRWANPSGWTVDAGILTRPSGQSTPSLSGYFAITHRGVRNLGVWIGAGNPSFPLWETQVWNRQGGSAVNLVLTDLDLEGGLEFYDGPWYLKVRDYGSGAKGYIEEFQIRLEGERKFSDETHILIPEGGTAYAFIGREASVAYVDADASGPVHDGSSWDTAFLTINDAVRAAPPGGAVWVAEGIYPENVSAAVDVAIYGGFLGAEPDGYEALLEERDFVSNITIIDGGGSGSCVTMADGARVDGFVVTNGTGTADRESTCGGGFYCSGLGDTAVIANCVIAGNSVEGCGGGIYCEDSSPMIVGSAILDNWAGVSGGGIYCVHFSSPSVIESRIARNSAGWDGGGVSCWRESSPALTQNVIFGNSAIGGGGVFCYHSSPILTGCAIWGNTASAGAGFQCTAFAAPILTNNTISRNAAAVDGGGIYCDTRSTPVITNNVVTENSGGGIWADGSTCPVLSHNDFWGNSPEDYVGCEPGTDDISVDPVFVDSASGDFHIKAGSPCIDAGADGAPKLPETDWDSEDRIANATVDIGADEYVTYYTAAPDPQPECDGALFGEPQAGYPGWVWFSVPMTPADSAAPNDVLGFACNGTLYRYDKYLKSPQVYQPPFTDWNLAVGSSYVVWLDGAVANPAYDGLSPFLPWEFEFKLGRQGWTWVGMPGLVETAGADFMSFVKVRYPSDESGDWRTAQGDYDATPDNWVTWSWPYWNTRLQAAQAFMPYAEFGHNTCYPWIGYRVWVEVGTALDEDDPDQVTLIWPKVD